MRISVIAPVLLAGAIIIAPACSAQQRDSSGRGRSEGNVPAKTIDQVLAAHRDSLMALPGVVGTAIGLCDNQRCIKVFLADSNPVNSQRVPGKLEGYRVVSAVTGTIRPR
jgi:hypothetical protein